MNELCHIWKSYMNELHMNALYKWVMSHINASSPHMNKLCYIWMRCNARVCHDKSVRVIHDSCIYTYAANSGATFCGILHVCAMTRVHLCDMTHVYICMQESVVQLSVVVYVAITWLSNRWYPYAGNSGATVCGVLHVCTMCGTSDGYVYIFVCR